MKHPGTWAAAGTTFRRVVLPLVFPSLVAGSIFTFSLTLGDYIVPDLVSDAKFIGNVIYDNSALGNLPVAAAYSIIPIVIVSPTCSLPGVWAPSSRCEARR